MDSPILMTRGQASKVAGLGAEIIARLIADGALREVDFYGERRVPLEALHRMIEQKLSAQLVTTRLEQQAQAEFPSLADLRNMKPRAVGPVTYTGRNGMSVKWPHPAYEYDFNLNGRQLTILVSVSDDPFTGANDELGAVVFRNGLRHSPQAVVEFARASNYLATKQLASVVKAEGKVVRPTEKPPNGYEQMTLGVYSSVVNRPYAKVGRCVLAKDDDIASLAYHGLLRCRQRGDI